MTVEGVTKEKVGIIASIPFNLAHTIGTIILANLIDRGGRRYMILRVVPFVFVMLVMVSISMGLSIFSEPDSNA